MGKWVVKVFNKKIVLNAVLAAFLIILYNGLKNTRFDEIDYFVRDALQFLNSPKEVDKSIVTLTININSDGITVPHTYESMKKVIDKVQEYSPRNIIIMMEPLDFNIETPEKLKLLNYLEKHKNIYVNGAEASNPNNSFNRDPIFRNFPRLLHFNRCSDSPQNRESRRTVLKLSSLGEYKIFEDFKRMDLNPKAVEEFEYSFDYWNSTQVYLKNYPLGTYGNYQSKDLFANKIKKEVFFNKIVVIGTNDEFSHMVSRSIFNLFGMKREGSYQKNWIPLQDTFANVLNLHLTGTYIKYLKNFDALLYVLIFLFALAIMPINLLYKIYIFLSAIPLLILIEFLIYYIGSFYFNPSLAILALLILQYISLPILTLIYFKRTEKEKMIAVNVARINALITVSEHVAHDIRSPLSTINLLLTRAKFETDEQRGLVISSLASMENIIENILSNVKQPNNNLNVKSIKIDSLVTHILLEKSIQNPKIQFTAKIPPSTLVYADETNLSRVVKNIIENSIDAFKDWPHPPAIVISSETQDKKIKLIIKDNGPGMPPNILSLIGEQQVSTKMSSGGHGIGVLQSKNLVEQMGGSLKVVSSLNDGTTVIISLNLAKV